MNYCVQSDFHRYNYSASIWGGVFVSFPLGSKDSPVYKEYNSKEILSDNVKAL